DRRKPLRPQSGSNSEKAVHRPDPDPRMPTSPAARRDGEFPNNPHPLRRKRLRKAPDQRRELLLRKAIEKEVGYDAVVRAHRPSQCPRIGLLKIHASRIPHASECQSDHLRTDLHYIELRPRSNLQQPRNGAAVTLAQNQHTPRTRQPAKESEPPPLERASVRGVF